MEIQTIIIVFVSLILGGAAVYLLVRSSKSSDDGVFEYLRQVMATVNEANKRQDEFMRFVSQGMGQQNKTFVEALRKNTADINQRLDTTGQIISRLNHSVGQMSEIGRAMKDLQAYITNPKLRGSLGENILIEALKQMLPSSLYRIQHTFGGGETVDAVVRLGETLIPIDAKFPIQNFEKMHKSEDKKGKLKAKKDFIRDIKKHITDIGSKYIQTNEGTVDYAIMYVPSESIYYEVVYSDELLSYAKDASVIIVSPMTLYAILRAILMSHQGIRVQQHARELLASIHSMQKDYNKVESALHTLERHVTNAFNQLQQVNKFFVRMGNTIAVTTTLSLNEKKTKKTND